MRDKSEIGGMNAKTNEVLKESTATRRAVDSAAAFVLEEQFPSVANLFSPYVALSAAEADVSVAFDTNVLLLPYGISKDDLSAIAKVYRLLAKEERLFLPARVAREFIKHRDQKLADMLKELGDSYSRLAVPPETPAFLLDGLSGYDDLAKATAAMREARKDYKRALDRIVNGIKGWRGNDPVSALYREVFAETRIVEHEGERAEIAREWESRLNTRTPPGYRDAAKSDTGIGDYLIWRTLLKLGADRKQDLVFVTGDTKSDWFVRSAGEPCYPRPELVDEFRRVSGGRSIRLSSLADLLADFDTPTEVVREVRQAEVKANNDVQIVLPFRAPFYNKNHVSVEFIYSANDGRIPVQAGDRKIYLRFSKASNEAVHLYRTMDTHLIGRVKSVAYGHPINLQSIDMSSSSYTINAGEVFVAINSAGDVLAGRITEIRDDSRGDAEDRIKFICGIFGPGEEVIAP